jgi:hypothetical protein
MYLRNRKTIVGEMFDPRAMKIQIRETKFRVCNCVVSIACLFIEILDVH